MALKIGRAGLTLALPEPQSWNSSGNQVTLTGTVGPVSPVTDALRLRDQLLGYVDNGDEPIVPVIIDGEPRLTGYYRVLGVQIPTDAVATALGIFSYSVQLQPVQGFTQPWLECIVSGALLTNGVGGVVADMQGIHGFPNPAVEYSPPYAASSSVVRTGADGGIFFVLGAAGAANVSGTGRGGVSPVNFYIGAATFEQGSPLQPVVGRTLAQADLVNWRLSNGLVRVTPNASAGQVDVSHYNGSSWSAVKTYIFSYNALAMSVINSLTVLRNSIEETVIRVSMSNAAGPSGGILFTLDFSLRRGDNLVRIYATTTYPSVNSWKVARKTVEAATAVVIGAVAAGAIRATANDGDSNRYVLLSFQNTGPVNDLVNGAITAGTGKSADFGIGSEIGGSGSTGFTTGALLAGQYLAAQSESQRVVAR